MTGDELRALLQQKECELFRVNYSVMTTLSPHHINALTREIEALRRQVAALVPKWELGPIGGSRLGSGFLPKPQPAESGDSHVHTYDPYLRAAEEFGWGTE